VAELLHHLLFRISQADSHLVDPITLTNPEMTNADGLA
jgi:hypothetical protein